MRSRAVNLVSTIGKPLWLGLIVFGGLATVSTILSVNMFPVLTNDSITYVAFSDDLSGFGMVHVGYRQFGYPLFLWLTETISTGVFSIEPLLFASFVQRALLVLGLTYAIWLWRWWSLPLVVAVLTAELISYTNLILTEGVSVPLALILVCVTGHYIFVAHGPDPLMTRKLTWVVGVVAVVVALCLVAIRFPFAVFGMSPLVITIAAWRTLLRRDALVLFGVYLVGAVLVIGMVSVENKAEYGEFSPSTRGARTEYWAAWTTTFGLNPSNASDPDLAEFHGTGDPYDFMAQVDSLDVPYSAQAAIYRQSVDEMLVAAGSGVWGSRMQSFLGALQGGRLNDIDGLIEEIEASDRMNVDDVIHSNAYSREEGPQAFADEFNDGQLPEAAITSPLAERFPLPTADRVIQILLPVSLVVCCVGLWNHDARLLAIAGLAAVVAYSALIGYIRGDNFRFLLTTSIYGIGAGAGSLAMWMSWRTSNIGTSR